MIPETPGADGRFAFVDESGVLPGSRQRFFALGLLKLEDTSALTERVHAIAQRAAGRLTKLTRRFE